VRSDLPVGVDVDNQSHPDGYGEQSQSLGYPDDSNYHLGLSVIAKGTYKLPSVDLERPRRLPKHRVPEFYVQAKQTKLGQGDTCMGAYSEK
jgi:hypothetical protein